MSDEEKFASQGRAHAALKTAKSNIATLAVSLREFSEGMRGLGQEIDRFLVDPGKRDPKALKPQFENLAHHLRALDIEKAASQLEEIYMEASRARQLEEEIAKF